MRFWKFIKYSFNNSEQQISQISHENNSNQEDVEQNLNEQDNVQKQQNSDLNTNEQNTNNNLEQPNNNQTQEQSVEQQDSAQSQENNLNQENNEQTSEQNSNNQDNVQEKQQNSNLNTNEQNTDNDLEQTEDIQQQGQNIEQQGSEQSQENNSNQEDVEQNLNKQDNDQNQQQNSDLNTIEQNTDNDLEQSNDNQQQEQKNNEQSHNENSNNNDLEAKKEKMKQLRDKLKEYVEKKQQEENSDNSSKDKSRLNNEKEETTESQEKEYELSEQTNNFINQLNELPSFENRNRGAGYSIDINGNADVPDSVIRTLITKFLNQRFCKKNTDLNIRSNSLEKTKGFYKWEVKDVIVHLKTQQITKVLDDKYGYEYAQGKNENVPLSFYFDMSGSMSKYTNLLAVIAIELLKKDVKVLAGFNEKVNVQINSVNKNIDVETFTKILESAGYNYSWGVTNANFKLDPRVNFQFINKNIDNYLISKKAEKCVIFSDFDPLREVQNLSWNTKVYWFCFEKNFSNRDLSNYNGFIYAVQNVKDIQNGLIKVNSNKFETLCYTNSKQLKRK